MIKYFILSLFVVFHAVTTAQTLEEIIRSNDALTTLSSAIDIVGWIPYDGDVTMFLPSDDALALLDPTYLTAGYIPHLKTIVAYHIAPGEVIYSEMVTDGYVLDMFAGTGSILATVNETGLFFSGASFSDAQVVTSNLVASNGVGHVVDRFFLPSQLTLTLLDLAGSVQGFDLVLEMVAASGLEGELTKENRTILAPSNAAFAALPSDFATQISSDPNLRADLLRYHILVGSIPLELITDGMQVMTAYGAPIVFTVVGGGRFQQISVSNPSLGKAITVETGNLVAANGIAHAVSGVLETGPRPPTAAPVDAPTDPSVTDPVSSPVSVPTASSAANSLLHGIAGSIFLASSCVVLFF